MSTGVIVCDADDAADRAWSEMRARGVHHLVVANRGRVVGVVSDRDLGGAQGTFRRSSTISELMSSPVVTATPDTTLRQAASLMRGRTIGCLPVVDGDHLVGIVTMTDLLEQIGRGAVRPASRAQRTVHRAPTGHHVIGRTPRARPRASRSISRRVRPSRRAAVKPPAPFLVHVRALSVRLNEEELAYVTRKVTRRLSKFASHVQRVSVRFEDENGPRGGVDMRCTVKVVLDRAPSVVVRTRQSSPRAAFDVAMDSVEEAVRRRLTSAAGAHLPKRRAAGSTTKSA